MFGELSTRLAPQYSNLEQMAINAGRDAAVLYRSLWRADRATAMQRAEQLINDQCPFSELQKAAEAFNREVDSPLKALVQTVDRSSRPWLRQTLATPLYRHIDPACLSLQKCIILIDQRSEKWRLPQAEPRGECQEKTLQLRVPEQVDRQEISTAPSPERTLQLLEKTLKLYITNAV